MRRWTALTALTGVLTAGILAVGTPAFATDITTLTQVCSTEEGTGIVYRLCSYAIYEDNVIGPGLRRWKSFHYMVTGGALPQDHNNVNIRLSESGTTVYSYNSPDSLRFNTWYSTAPDSLVLTSVWGPEGEHDHRANDLLRFEGIFDNPSSPDPRCANAALL